MATFGVITEIDQSGNMASALGNVYTKSQAADEYNGWQDGYEAVPFATAMNLHQPVFWKGEIIVLDDNGREIGGMGRKPGKWYVTCEQFDNVEDAIARAREVNHDA